ncbi:MAG: hypothetical protein AB1478_06170, partial [Nitrospirota bacterium]
TITALCVGKVSKELNSGIYYLTFTIRNWYYIFDRHNRFEILAESLKYCQRHKGLKIYAYVFKCSDVRIEDYMATIDVLGAQREISLLF